MQPSEHEYLRPSPPIPFENVENDIQIQTRYDGSANKVIHVTNYNQRGRVSLDNFPDDSCDSFLNDDSISLPGRPSGESLENYSFTAVLTKCNESVGKENNEQTETPYHRFKQSPSAPQSPQQELDELIKTVESNTTVAGKLTAAYPKLEIVEEPETTYRARYESEGCKGPIHGASETGFPSVKIVGYVGEVTLNVFVVTSDFEPHLHTATGPGSSKSPCKEVKLDDGTIAIQMIIKPTDENDDMIAVFDQLSIRRVRNWEADRELRKRGIEPASWKSKKKEAKLAFQAIIARSEGYHDGYTLTTYSRPFLCTAPSGNPEIWWASCDKSTAEGGEEMGFIGKKFASGFKVRFYSKEDDGNTWETYADIDRGKSNLNACVVKIPPYKDVSLAENVAVHVEIRVGSEKEPRCSEPWLFTYTAKKLERCENCIQIKSYLQKICNGDTAEGPTFNLVKIKPEVKSPRTTRIQPLNKNMLTLLTAPTTSESCLQDLLKNTQTTVKTAEVTNLTYEKHLSVVTPFGKDTNEFNKLISTAPLYPAVTAVSLSHVNAVKTPIPRAVICMSSTPRVNSTTPSIQGTVLQASPESAALANGVATTNFITPTPVNRETPIGLSQSIDNVKQEQPPTFYTFGIKQANKQVNLNTSTAVDCVSPTVVRPLVCESVSQSMSIVPPFQMDKTSTSVSPPLNSPVIKQQAVTSSILQTLSALTGQNQGSSSFQNQILVLANALQSLQKQIEINNLQPQPQLQFFPNGVQSNASATMIVSQALNTSDHSQMQIQQSQSTQLQTPTRPLQQQHQQQQQSSPQQLQQQQSSPQQLQQQFQQQQQLLQHQPQQLPQPIQPSPQQPIQPLQTSNQQTMQALQTSQQHTPLLQISPQQMQQVTLQQLQPTIQQIPQKTMQSIQQLQDHQHTVLQAQQQTFQFQQSMPSCSYNNPVMVGNIAPIVSTNISLLPPSSRQEASLQLNDLQHSQQEPVPMELYQQSNESPTIVFQQQQQQHLVSPSFDQLPTSQQHINNSTFDQSNVVASLNNEWSPPTINDAIATNKIGFQDGTTDSVKLSTESQLEMSVEGRDNFLKTLQHLNSGLSTSGTQLGLDPTGMLVGEGNTSVSLQQQIQQMETNLVNGQIISSST